MNDLEPSTDHPRLSAADLRKLPADERAAILRAQAATADEHYRRDRALTDFEAYGEDDLHDDGRSAEAR